MMFPGKSVHLQPTQGRCASKYASIEVVDARDLSPELDCRFRMRRPGSSRHTELASPKYAAFGDCRCRGRIWNDFCCNAGPNCNAQAPIKRGHEPKNGSNHGNVSGPLGLLRFIDSFATSGAMEHHRGVGQFAECRRVLVFCPRRKTSTSESVKRIPLGRSLSSIVYTDRRPASRTEDVAYAEFEDSVLQLCAVSR